MAIIIILVVAAWLASRLRRRRRHVEFRDAMRTPITRDPLAPRWGDRRQPGRRR